MRISCPHCGERALDEFLYSGDAKPRRPDAAASDAASAFYAFAYLRDNVAGPQDELWFHAAGCHAWLVVTRDTRTHDISAVRLASVVALERDKGAAA
ncbi:MAG: sarcosine oxidase subunit delta [Hyphomicrobiaceae bacterium]